MPNHNVSQNNITENTVAPADWSTLKSHLTTAVASSLSTPSALATDPDELRSAIDQAVVNGLGIALQNAAERWADEVIGAGRYQQADTRVGYRSGGRRHVFHFSAGPVAITVPKPRRGPSRPEWVVKDDANPVVQRARSWLTEARLQHRARDEAARKAAAKARKEAEAKSAKARKEAEERTAKAMRLAAAATRTSGSTVRWALIGGGAVVAVAAAVFGGVIYSDWQSYKDTNLPNDANFDKRPEVSHTEAQAEADRVGARLTAAAVVSGLGIIAAAAGATVFSGATDAKAADSTWRLAPTHNGGTLTVRF